MAFYPRHFAFPMPMAAVGQITRLGRRSPRPVGPVQPRTAAEILATTQQALSMGQSDAVVRALYLQYATQARSEGQQPVPLAELFHQLGSERYRLHGLPWPTWLVSGPLFDQVVGQATCQGPYWSSNVPTQYQRCLLWETPAVGRSGPSGGTQVAFQSALQILRVAPAQRVAFVAAQNNDPEALRLGGGGNWVYGYVPFEEYTPFGGGGSVAPSTGGWW